MKLNHKIALVTGGSRGIGKAICLKLAHCGAEVIVSYKENESGGKATVDNIIKDGGKAALLKLVLPAYESINAAFNFLQEKYQALDVLVNSAGINRPDDFDKINGIDIDKY